MTGKQRWLIVVLYAAAMAYVEAAVVLYLRTMVDRVDPYQSPPVTLPDDLVRAEMVREVATLIMLVAVGWLAGRTGRARRSPPRCRCRPARPRSTGWPGSWAASPDPPPGGPAGTGRARWHSGRHGD